MPHHPKSGRSHLRSTSAAALQFQLQFQFHIFLRFDLPDKRMSCPSCSSLCPLVCVPSVRQFVRSSVCPLSVHLSVHLLCPLSVVHLNVRFTLTVRSLKDRRSKPPIVTRDHRAIADVLKSFFGVTCKQLQWGVKSCLKVTCHEVWVYNLSSFWKRFSEKSLRFS